METLVGILVLATPVVLLLTLTASLDRREQRRRRATERQIALTDAIHARLGAVAAPVVRLGRAGWHITVAVPFERPAVADAVLATVHELFGSGDYEVVLSRQTLAVPSTKASRPLTHGEESLSWT